MVYPTLLAAIGDVAHPSWRASAVGVYRLWRDLGYAVGALLAGFTADRFGLAAAVWRIVAAYLRVRAPSPRSRMTETLPQQPENSGATDTLHPQRPAIRHRAQL